MFDRLNHDALAEKFKTLSVDFWRNLLKSFLVERPHVTVLGYPSQKERGLRSYLETERRNHQVQTLGKEGLLEKAEILKKASEENEVSMYGDFSILGIVQVFSHLFFD